MGQAHRRRLEGGRGQRSAARGKDPGALRQVEGSRPPGDRHDLPRVELTMNSSRLIGLILLVSGLILLGIAYQQSGSFADQTKHFFTGDYRDKTTWMIAIGGIGSLLGLASLLALGRRGRG